MNKATTHSLKLQNLSYLILRVLGSGIFLIAGLNHIFETSNPVARLESAPFGFLATSIFPAEMLVILSGIGLLTGGVFLLIGFKTRIAALLLILILIPISLTIQAGSTDTLGPLFKNIAIAGILFFFIVNGSLAYSLDHWLKKKKTQSPVRGAGAASLVIAMLLSSYPSTAHSASPVSYDTSKQDYAVLISQPGHLGAAVHTAKTMIADKKYNTGEFVVMACGRSVEAFTQGSSTDMSEVYKDGKEAGITFVVCGMSLENFGIGAETIFEGTQITPNGLTYMFDLKLKGFETIEL